jgi:hypothetical protein
MIEPSRQAGRRISRLISDSVEDGLSSSELPLLINERCYKHEKGLYFRLIPSFPYSLLLDNVSAYTTGASAVRSSSK